MDRLEQAAQVIGEALCMHEALVRLGFSPRDVRIQLAYTATPELAMFPERTKMHDVCLWVGISYGGGWKTWRYCIGPAGIGGVEFERLFFTKTQEFNSLQGAEGERVWEASRAKALLPDVRESIKRKGIPIPADGRSS